jgi:hypothetical protein
MERAQRGWRLDLYWLVIFGGLSSAWCVTAARQLGATFDEPVYAVEGLRHWRTGSTGGMMKLGTMPLPVDVQHLPVHLWERWRGEPFDPVAELHTFLPVSRSANLVFWWALLIYAMLAARCLAGWWAGRLAVALLACEPCLLGHTCLATTDLSVAACVLALVYHFRIGREAAWPRRVGLPALWLTLATLAKASGPVLGLMALAAVELERRWVRARAVDGTGWRDWLVALRRDPGPFPFWRDVVQACAIATLLTFVYCGSDWEPLPDAVRWAHSLPDDATGRAAVAVAENLRVFPNAGWAFLRQTGHNIRGHGTYLLGQTHRRALWYYFPVLLTIKLSPVLLLLPAVVAALHWRALGNWACAAALALLCFSVVCRVQIGVRFMFPLIALACVGLAVATVQAWRVRGRAWRASLAALLVAGLGWSAGSALRAWPHGLAHVNDLWGGTAEGYRLVSDGNYDWGQGLKDLAGWQRQHGDKPLRVWYFGTDPLLPTLPVRLAHLERGAPEDVGRHLDELAGTRLAVATTLLYGPDLTAAATAARRRLRAVSPVGRTPTFVIYEFPPGVRGEGAKRNRAGPRRETKTGGRPP